MTEKEIKEIMLSDSNAPQTIYKRHKSQVFISDVVWGICMTIIFALVIYVFIDDENKMRQISLEKNAVMAIKDSIIISQKLQIDTLEIYNDIGIKLEPKK
jgi:hypothetical protein